MTKTKKEWLKHLKLVKRIKTLLTKVTTQDLDLTGVNLQGATTSGSNCRNTFQIGTDFKWSCFQSANCYQVDFKWANLEKADFKEAKFDGARLEGVILTDVDFDGADISGADLSKANVKYLKVTKKQLDEMIKTAIIVEEQEHDYTY